MSKKKKLAPTNKDTYLELQKRLKRKLKDIEKRGFTPNSAFREEWLGELPKKVQKKNIQKLQEVIGNIYQYVRYYDPLKEVYISGVERRFQERAEAARKGWERRRERESVENIPQEVLQAIQTIEEIINEWTANVKWSQELQDIKEEDKDTISNVFKGARETLGDDVFARNLIKNQAEIIPLLNQILFESGNKYKVFSGDSGRDGVRKAIARITSLIYDRPLTVQESIGITGQSEALNESQ